MVSRATLQICQNKLLIGDIRQWKDDLEAYRPRDWKQTQAAMLEAEKPFHIDDIPGMFDKDDPTTSTTQSTDHVMTDTSSIHMYDADEPFLNSSIQMKEEQVSLSPAKSALSSSPPLPLGHGQLHSPPSTSNMSHLTASDPNPADLPHIPELSFRDTAFDATPKPISDARATTESADMAQHAQNASPKADAVQKQDSSPLIASGEHDIQMEGETGPGLDVPGLDEMHGDEPPSNKTSALNISAGHEATAIPEATQPTQVKPEISIQSSAQLQASASSDKATKSPSEHDHEGDFEDELSLVIPAQGQRHPEEPTDLAAPTFIPSKTTLAPQIPGLSYRPDEPVTPSTKITSAVQGEAKAGKLLNDATVAATFLDTEVSEGGSTNEAIVPPTAQDHPRTPFSSIFPGYIAEKAPEVISRSLQAATMDPFAAPQMPAKGVRNTSETGDPHQNLISVGPFPKPKAHTPPPQPNSSPSKGPTSPASKISSANQSSSSEDPLSLPGPTPTPIRSPAPSSNNSNTLRHVGSTPQASVVIPSAKAGRNPRNRADPANSPAVTRRRSQNAAKVEQDEKGKGKGKRGRKSSTASASHQGPAKKVRRSARVSSEGATTEESGKQ